MPRPYALVSIIYVVGYVALDWLSYVQPFAAFGITPWSPQTGLTIALMVLYGPKYLPLLPVALLLADASVRGFPLPAWAELVSVLIVSMGYGLACLALGHPRFQFNASLSSKRDLGLLLGICGAAAIAVAVGDVGTLVAEGLLKPSRFAAAVAKFWIGDMIGIAIITPFTLVLLTRARLPRWHAEMLIPLVMLVAGLWLSFGYSETFRFRLFYLLFLPVTWAAVRFSL